MGLIKTGIMAGVGYAAVNKVTTSLERSRQNTPTPPRQIPQHQCSCPYCPGLVQDYPPHTITSGHSRGYPAQLTQRTSPDYREDYRDAYERDARESRYSPDPREYRESQQPQLRQRMTAPTTNDYPFPPAYAPSESAQSARGGMGGLPGGGGFIEEIVTGLSSRSGKGGWQ